MNRSASATITSPKTSRTDFIVAEVLAAHMELDALDVPRGDQGGPLTLSQRMAILRTNLDKLRVHTLPPNFGKQIPGGADAWQNSLS